MRPTYLLVFWCLLGGVFSQSTPEISAPPPKIGNFKFGPPSEKYNSASWSPGFTNVLKSDRLQYAERTRMLQRRLNLRRGRLGERLAPEIYGSQRLTPWTTTTAYDPFSDYGGPMANPRRPIPDPVTSNILDYYYSKQRNLAYNAPPPFPYRNQYDFRYGNHATANPLTLSELAKLSALASQSSYGYGLGSVKGLYYSPPPGYGTLPAGFPLHQLTMGMMPGMVPGMPMHPGMAPGMMGMGMPGAPMGGLGAPAGGIPLGIGPNGLMPTGSFTFPSMGNGGSGFGYNPMMGMYMPSYSPTSLSPQSSGASTSASTSGGESGGGDT